MENFRNSKNGNEALGTLFRGELRYNKKIQIGRTKILRYALFDNR